MNTFSTKELFGTELENLWNNPENTFSGYDGEVKERGFAIQDKISYGGLMFVGINPSFNDKTDGLGFCYYDPTFVHTHPYYLKFSEISENVGLPWSHLDLMFVRETSQNFIKYAYKNPRFEIFLKKQYHIAKQIIRKAKPDVIIVNNMLAHDWLMNDAAIPTPIFDEELGTYRITDGELKGTPIFFTSMLTGQRALDRGSYMRLIWHIKFVLKKIRG